MNKPFKQTLYSNGLTVKELKDIVKDWPECNEYGDPCEVWIGDSTTGFSNQVKEVIPLNKREFDEEPDKFYADLLLEF